MKKNKTLHYGLIQSSYWLSYLPFFALSTTFLLDAGYNNIGRKNTDVIACLGSKHVILTKYGFQIGRASCRERV